MSKASKVGACCKDCTEKFEACHDVCADYLKAKNEWETERERIRAIKDKERIWDDYHFRAVKKTQKIVTNKRKKR